MIAFEQLVAHTLRYMHKYRSFVWHIALKGYVFMDSPVSLSTTQLLCYRLYTKQYQMIRMPPRRGGRSFFDICTRVTRHRYGKDDMGSQQLQQEVLGFRAIVNFVC